MLQFCIGDIARAIVDPEQRVSVRDEFTDQRHEFDLAVGLPRQLIPEKFEDALAQGYIIAGSAATVRERMKRDNEIAGINYCLCRMAFGDLSFEESKHSLELFAKEVMPAL
jgi:alkanesulfonate monooxygenase SsuD/methylene tetrahydromethanopterin reductase-like flavin-dependent oxidoreductase (luciferase family)